MTSVPGTSPRLDNRLWPALSRPFVQRQPVKGFDRFGAWLTGVGARVRAAPDLGASADRVMLLARGLEDHSDGALGHTIEEVRDRARSGAEGVVERAAACVCEAIRRETSIRLHREQVMGGLAMVRGCLCEMATGEGKTLTAIIPAAVRAWDARSVEGGVHVFTVNDYLANRDATGNTPIFRRLGLSVGVVQDSFDARKRREAYSRDIVYGADKQFLFDHLRDRLHMPLNVSLTSHLLDQMTGGGGGGGGGGSAGWHARVVQRGLYCAIVDEADSILIDEAVTPAIIADREQVPASSDSDEQTRHEAADGIARRLERGTHFKVRAELRRVELTDAGRGRVGELSGVLPAFWRGPRRREEIVTLALSAHHLHARDDDYIVRKNSEGEREIAIIDRSTGRVLEGRQWQLGLHQAVEVKEGLGVTRPRETTARSSYQRFFQRYRYLTGMTGTAWEVRHELWRDYRLAVVRIPTHRPVVRKHEPDRVFRTAGEKFEAVVEEVARQHATGRPVLVGTRSVESSELVGAELGERGIRCRVLNAVREREEAEIVEGAGVVGAVTVATNMAGRGTDILLTDQTRALGGLVVVATERHDERRVDRQLFGRAGRQGDPGSAVAFVSLEDRLVQRTGLPMLSWLVGRTGGAFRRVLGSLLWKQAQFTASRRLAVQRRESAKYDAWLDLALHHRTR